MVGSGENTPDPVGKENQKNRKGCDNRKFFTMPPKKQPDMDN